MLKAATTKRFEKDVELARKRGKDLKKMRDIMELLLAKKKLPSKCMDHWLKGNFVYRKECHIEPDWLLIYKPEKTEILFERTGSHADLFN